MSYLNFLSREKRPFSGPQTSEEKAIKSTTPKILSESQLIIDDENQMILNEVTKKKSQTLSIEQRKEELQQMFSKILNSLKSDKQCDVFEKIINSVPSQIEAIDMLNAKETNFPTANKDVPPNKNIPQRFSNAKKKRKLRPKTLQ